MSPGAGCNVTEAGQCGGNSKKNGYAFDPNFLSSLSYRRKRKD